MYKIGILFQNRDFEHDVYELIKAFYPGNEIVSLYEEDDADYDIRFRVLRDEEGYTISYNNGIEKKNSSWGCDRRAIQWRSFGCPYFLQ